MGLDIICQQVGVFIYCLLINDTYPNCQLSMQDKTINQPKSNAEEDTDTDTDARAQE